MPEQTVGPTVGELMRADQRIEHTLEQLRVEVNQRLDALNDRAVPIDRYQERNLAVEAKLADAMTSMATTSARLEAAVNAETTRALTAEERLEARMDNEKRERTTTMRYLLGGVVVAVGTSLVDLLRGTGVTG